MNIKNKSYLDAKNSIEKHFTASALIINKEGKVLLMNHKKLGAWLYPGGHINTNETPDETVVREVKEETGLDVEIISDRNKDLADHKTDVLVLHQPYAILYEKIPGDIQHHYHIDMIYFCEIKKGNDQLINNTKELADIAFFGLNDLKRIELFSNFRKLLEKVLNEYKVK